MKQFSKKNGYYKYYNSDGLSTRIKVNELEIDSKGILIKFLQNGHWMYHTPDAKKHNFENAFDCINFILKNLENENLVFEVISLKEKLN